MIVPFLFGVPHASYPSYYLWCFYLGLDFAKKHGFPIIANEEYFQSPKIFAAKNCNAAFLPGWANSFCYELPCDADFEKVLPYPISDSFAEDRLVETGSYNDLAYHLLKERDTKFEALLESMFDDMENRCGEKVEALVTITPYASLYHLAEKRGFRVIQYHMGHFRPPFYRNTNFFDFKYLYGENSVEARFAAFEEEREKNPIEILKPKEVLSFFLQEEYHHLLERLDEKPNYQIGVALGAAVCSVDALQSNYNDFELLNRVAHRFGKKNMLVRKHPADPFAATYPHYKKQISQEGSILDFYLNCEEIVSLSSNTSIEAMYWGKKTWCILDTTHSMVCGRKIEEDAKMASDAFLHFYAFCYLIPYELLTDLDYLRWRLSEPSELAIYERHLEFYQNTE